VTLKETVWLACRTKTCCHAPIVVPTGRDVWRISRALDTPPWAFVRYFPSPSARGDAFALDQSEQRYRLALAKGASRRKQPPCIFLMRTRNGHHRCGLGDLRPASCKAFPSDLFGGVLCTRNDGGCTCRTWSVLDVDVAEEAELVVRREEEAAEYRGLVAEWNRLVSEAEPGATADFFDFCRFVVEAYDALAASEASP
jgi:Fe-S-cluster containining protein